jgi:hypothetical protein
MNRTSTVVKSSLLVRHGDLARGRHENTTHDQAGGGTQRKDPADAELPGPLSKTARHSALGPRCKFYEALVRSYDAVHGLSVDLH